MEANKEASATRDSTYKVKEPAALAQELKCLQQVSFKIGLKDIGDINKDDRKGDLTPVLLRNPQQWNELLLQLSTLKAALMKELGSHEDINAAHIVSSEIVATAVTCLNRSAPSSILQQVIDILHLLVAHQNSLQVMGDDARLWKAVFTLLAHQLHEKDPQLTIPLLSLVRQTQHATKLSSQLVLQQLQQQPSVLKHIVELTSESNPLLKNISSEILEGLVDSGDGHERHDLCQQIMEVPDLLAMSYASVPVVIARVLSSLNELIELGSLKSSWSIPYPALSGYLMVEASGLRKSWQKRWFSLAQNFLYRYGDRDWGQAKEKIYLPNCGISLSDSNATITIHGQENTDRTTLLSLRSCSGSAANDGSANILLWQDLLKQASQSQHLASVSKSRQNKLSRPAYVAMDGLKLAHWDDLSTEKFVPYLASILQVSSPFPVEVIEVAMETLAILSSYGNSTQRAVLVANNVLSLASHHVRASTVKTKRFAAQLLANIVESPAGDSGTTANTALKALTSTSSSMLSSTGQAIVKLNTPAALWDLLSSSDMDAVYNAGRCLVRLYDSVPNWSNFKKSFDFLAHLQDFDADETLITHLGVVVTEILDRFAKTDGDRQGVLKGGGVDYLLCLSRLESENPVVRQSLVENLARTISRIFETLTPLSEDVCLTQLELLAFTRIPAMVRLSASLFLKAVSSGIGDMCVSDGGQIVSRVASSGAANGNQKPGNSGDLLGSLIYSQIQTALPEISRYTTEGREEKDVVPSVVLEMLEERRPHFFQSPSSKDRPASYFSCVVRMARDAVKKGLDDLSVEVALASLETIRLLACYDKGRRAIEKQALPILIDALTAGLPLAIQLRSAGILVEIAAFHPELHGSLASYTTQFLLTVRRARDLDSGKHPLARPLIIAIVGLLETIVSSSDNIRKTLCLSGGLAVVCNLIEVADSEVVVSAVELLVELTKLPMNAEKFFWDHQDYLLKLFLQWNSHPCIIVTTCRLLSNLCAIPTLKLGLLQIHVVMRIRPLTDILVSVACLRDNYASYDACQVLREIVASAGDPGSFTFDHCFTIEQLKTMMTVLGISNLLLPEVSLLSVYQAEAPAFLNGRALVSSELSSDSSYELQPLSVLTSTLAVLAVRAERGALPSLASLPFPAKSGWLCVPQSGFSSIVRSWAKKWFVLCDEYLYRFDNRATGMNEARDKIWLGGCHVRYTEVHSRKCLEVMERSGDELSPFLILTFDGDDAAGDDGLVTWYEPMLEISTKYYAMSVPPSPAQAEGFSSMLKRRSLSFSSVSTEASISSVSASGKSPNQKSKTFYGLPSQSFATWFDLGPENLIPRLLNLIKDWDDSGVREQAGRVLVALSSTAHPKKRAFLTNTEVVRASIILVRSRYRRTATFGSALLANVFEAPTHDSIMALADPLVTVGATHRISLLLQLRGPTTDYHAVRAMLSIAKCRASVAVKVLHTLDSNAFLGLIVKEWPYMLHAAIGQQMISLITTTALTRSDKAMIADKGGLEYLLFLRTLSRPPAIEPRKAFLMSGTGSQQEPYSGHVPVPRSSFEVGAAMDVTYFSTLVDETLIGLYGQDDAVTELLSVPHILSLSETGIGRVVLSCTKALAVFCDAKPEKILTSLIAPSTETSIEGITSTKSSVAIENSSPSNTILRNGVSTSSIDSSNSVSASPTADGAEEQPTQAMEENDQEEIVIDPTASTVGTEEDDQDPNIVKRQEVADQGFHRLIALMVEARNGSFGNCSARILHFAVLAVRNITRHPQLRSRVVRDYVVDTLRQVLEDARVWNATKAAAGFSIRFCLRTSYVFNEVIVERLLYLGLSLLKSAEAEIRKNPDIGWLRLAVAAAAYMAELCMSSAQNRVLVTESDGLGTILACILVKDNEVSAACCEALVALCQTDSIRLHIASNYGSNADRIVSLLCSETERVLAAATKALRVFCFDRSSKLRIMLLPSMIVRTQQDGKTVTMPATSTASTVPSLTGSEGGSGGLGTSASTGSGSAHVSSPNLHTVTCLERLVALSHYESTAVRMHASQILMDLVADTGEGSGLEFVANSLPISHLLILSKAVVPSVAGCALSVLSAVAENGAMSSATILPFPAKIGWLDTDKSYYSVNSMMHLRLSKPNRRWFVLCDDFLYRYALKPPALAEAKEKWYLRACQVRMLEDRKTGKKAIEVVCGPESLLLHSPAEDEAIEDWHTAIAKYASPMNAGDSVDIGAVDNSDSISVGGNEGATNNASSANAFAIFGDLLPHELAGQESVARKVSGKITDRLRRNNKSGPIIYGLDKRRYAMWADLEIDQNITHFIHAAGNSRDESVSVPASHLLASIAKHGSERKWKLVVSLDLIATAVVLTRSKIKAAAQNGATVLAGISQWDYSTPEMGIKPLTMMMQLGGGSSLVQLIREGDPYSIYYASLALYQVACQRDQLSLQLLELGVVDAYVKIELEKFDPVLRKSLYRISCKLISCFVTNVDQKIRIFKQGGVEYLFSMYMSVELDRKLFDEVGLVLSSLFGTNDGAVSILPIKSVMLLAGSNIIPAKVQAANAFATLAKDYAQSCSDQAEIMSLVMCLMALLEEASSDALATSSERVGKRSALSPAQAREIIGAVIEALSGLNTSAQHRTTVGEAIPALISILRYPELSQDTRLSASILLENLHEGADHEGLIAADNGAATVLSSFYSAPPDSPYADSLAKLLSICSNFGNGRQALCDNNAVAQLFILWASKPYSVEAQAQMLRALGNVLSVESFAKQRFLPIKKKTIPLLLKALQPSISMRVQEATLYCIDRIVSHESIRDEFLKLERVKPLAAVLLSDQPLLARAATKPLKQLLTDCRRESLGNNALKKLMNDLEQQMASMDALEARNRRADPVAAAAALSGNTAFSGLASTMGQPAGPIQFSRNLPILSTHGVPDSLDLFIRSKVIEIEPLRVAFFCIITYLFGIIGVSMAWVVLLLVIWYYFQGAVFGMEVHSTTVVSAVVGLFLLYGCAASQSPFLHTLGLGSAGYLAFTDREKQRKGGGAHFNALDGLVTAEAVPGDKHYLDWLNDTMEAVWLCLNKATIDTIVWAVQPLIDSTMPYGPIKAIVIDTLDFGPVPPRITQVKAIKVDATGSCLDIDIKFAGKPKIVLNILFAGPVGPVKIPVSVKTLQISGCLRLQFRALVPVWPLFSAISVSFTQKPSIVFSVTTLKMDVMNVPLLSSKLQELLMRVIMDTFVLPNVVTAPDWRPEMIEYMRSSGVPDLPDGWFASHPALAAELIQAAATAQPIANTTTQQTIS